MSVSTAPQEAYAEGMGFEPMRSLPLRAFKARALGHYANPPEVRHLVSHDRPQ